MCGYTHTHTHAHTHIYIYIYIHVYTHIDIYNILCKYINIHIWWSRVLDGCVKTSLSLSLSLFSSHSLL